MTIYIVGGSCGEFDDYVTWDLQAYSTLEKAQEKIKQLENWMQENNLVKGNYINYVPQCPFDDKFKYEPLTGTHYSIGTLQLD